MVCQVIEFILIEIAYSDSPYSPFFVCTFKSSVGAVIISEWQRDQDKVYVIFAEPLETILLGCLCFFFSGIVNPYFCDNEELLARDSTFGDSFAYAFLIAIVLSRINEPVACCNGIADASFAFCRIYLV